jgi:alkylation response protein AidB-like acyl-CoA dehydrogenase
MDFDFSDEQYMMRDSALGLFNRIADLSVVRRIYENPGDIARRLASDLAAQGMLAGSIPEAYGGNGLSLLDFALVLEAAGRTLLPYPLAETFVAGDVIARHGTEAAKGQYLPGIASGERIATVAWGGPEGRWDAAGVQMTGRAGSWRLYGRRTFVPFGGEADFVLVPVARTDVEVDPVALVAVDPRRAGVTVTALASLDGSYPLASLAFDGYAVDMDSVVATGTRAWQDALNVGRVLAACEMLGTAEEVFQKAVDYIKIREQFGQPVGRFQGLKHIAADDYMLLESARVAVRYACWVASEGQADAPLYVALAKAYTSDMAKRVTGDAIQLHGGIGFTWDSDVHFFFKRAWRLASQLGTAAALREGMAKSVIDGRPVAAALAD